MKSYHNKIARVAIVSTSLIVFGDLLFADDNISRLDERLTRLEQVLEEESEKRRRAEEELEKIKNGLV